MFQLCRRLVAASAPLSRRPARLRPRPSSCASRHPRRPGRLHLRRRPVDALRRPGGAADPAHRASGARAVRQVLARRQVDRVHRPVRRRRAGLRHARRPAACRSSSPSIPPAARCAALGLRQPGLRLDAATARPSSSARCATAGTCPTPGSTPCRVDGGLGEPLPMPMSGAGDFSPGRQAGRLLAARPRLPHLEALPGRLGAGPLHLRPRQPRGARTSPRTRAPSATRCGSATRSTSSPTAPAR